MNGQNAGANGSWLGGNIEFDIAGLHATGHVAIRLHVWRFDQPPATVNLAGEFVTWAYVPITTRINAVRIFFGTGTPTANGVASGSSAYLYGIKRA